MLREVIVFFFSNFSLVMFDLAIIFVIIHKLMAGKRIAFNEIVYRWVALFALGFSGLYAGIMHTMFPEVAARNIGWQTSPFQWEVGVADLALGLIGVLSFKASYGFRLATVIAATVFLWGAALGHIYQMVKFQNYNIGNAGSWFWMDVLIPVILIICLIGLKQKRTG